MNIGAQQGKRIIITGANSGIGFHAARVLALHGAHVVLACRDVQRGGHAVSRIQAMRPMGQVELAALDLASLASVRAFAERELANAQPLHTLINNAGVMAPPVRRVTDDGFELQFGTNVLGHFALTALLMPALKRTALADAPRIVTVASIAHKRGSIDFGDLQSTRRYSPMQSYQQSKLADLIWALELDRRLRASASPIRSIAAHPGVANTNLFRAGERNSLDRAAREIASRAIGLLLNTDEDGALPLLYAATSTEAVGGGYYGPTGFLEMRGQRVGNAIIAPQARDTATAARLWTVCEAATGTTLAC